MTTTAPGTTATAKESASELHRLIEQWPHALQVHTLLTNVLLGLCGLTPTAYREAIGTGVNTLLNYSHAEKALRLQQQAVQEFDKFLATLEELRLALLEIK